MADLPVRAARAGAEIEMAPSGSLDALKGLCDLVLIDAPCSGSGAWRRNPDAKWRLTQARLEGLQAVQSELLEQATRLCAPGGRIVYATCSLLEEENSSRIESFCARHPGWTQTDSMSILPPAGDGFFAAIVRR